MSLATPLQAGLDHRWFPFRTTADADLFQPEEGINAVVCVIVVLQAFPIDAKATFPIVGLNRPYPDIGTFTQRQVGCTDGLWRLADSLEALDIPTTFALERQALPELEDIKTLLRAPAHAVIAAGEHAARVHAGEMAPGEEAGIIADCKHALEDSLGRAIVGWRSPHCSQSSETLSHLAAAGFRYVGDFANDDRPYTLTADTGALTAVPMNHFYSDLYLLHECRQPMADYVEATQAAARCLARERAPGAACLSLVVHPWLMGVPHRCEALAGLLAALRGMTGVRFMTTDEVARRCTSKEAVR